MKKKIQIACGLILGLGLLWLLFRGVIWHEVFKAIKEVSPGWLLLGAFFILMSFMTRVQRWSYVVRTAKPVSFRHMFSATQIGFLANFTLPGRVGEAIRAVVLGRLAHIPFSRCLAMVALDRVNDLIGLVVLMLLTALVYVPQGVVVIPKKTLGLQNDFTFEASLITKGEYVAVVGLLGCIVVLVSLYLNQKLVLKISDAILRRFSHKLADHAHVFLNDFALGLHVFRSLRDMTLSIFWSLITWTCFVLFFEASMQAFHIETPWYTVLVMQVLLAVFISVPGAPGFVGQFHTPLVVTLMMLAPGMEDSRAKAFAIVTHLINLILIGGVGLMCLWREDFHVADLSKKTNGMPEEDEAL